MQNQVIHYFAKLVTSDVCTLNDIPEIYRQAVSDYISSPPAPIENIIEDEVKSDILGALHLEDVNNTVNTEEFKTNGFVWAPFKTTNIFSSCIRDKFPTPIDVGYKIILCESEYALFGNNPQVELYTTDYGFELKIYGDIDPVPSDTILLRVDILVKAKNYEDMRLTAYIKAK